MKFRARSTLSSYSDRPWATCLPCPGNSCLAGLIKFCHPEKLQHEGEWLCWWECGQFLDHCVLQQEASITILVLGHLGRFDCQELRSFLLFHLISLLHGSPLSPYFMQCSKGNISYCLRIVIAIYHDS